MFVHVKSIVLGMRAAFHDLLHLKGRNIMSLISVVIPAFNASKTIERAINSVLNQSMREFEIIVVDDGSSDNSAKIVQQFTSTYPIKLIQQINQGPGHARNVGLDNSILPFICFLDADDEIYSSHFETAMKHFDSEDISTYCGFLHKTDNGKKCCMLDYFRNIGVSQGLITNLSSIDSINLLGYVWAHSQGGTISRTKHIREMGGYYQKHRYYYGEDSYLWLKSLFNGNTFFNFVNVGWYHCEDSKIHGGGKPINEPCFLLDPDELRASCPQKYQNLLEGFFGLFALHVCMTFHIPNKNYDKAATLIERFPSASKFEFYDKIINELPSDSTAKASFERLNLQTIQWWNRLHGESTVVE